MASEGQTSADASAGSIFRARVVTSPRERTWPFNILVVAFSTWTGEGLEREPRHRVLVSRHGSSHGVGVGVSNRRKAAERTLALVERDLERLTVAEFTAQYDVEELLQ